ncbi:YqhA family protein [Neptuniibacter sp. QD48_11]|uniref:YqhA family protein n=1 Tax=unclassified Neptuniibacter TaxID=2630693 RepID=UPI0039F51162
MRKVEQGLWSLRWIMLLTVFSVMAGALLLVGFVIYDFVHLAQVAFSEGIGLNARTELLMILIEIIDQALMAGVMLMFSFGIYEIFISKMNVEGGSSQRPKLLVIESIDQLKGKLGAMVIMMLIVKFLSLSTEMEISEPSDLLMYAASVALLGLALFLTNAKMKDKQAK